MAQPKIKKTTIDELVPDDKNFNRGTEYGQHLMERSFSKFGAGRSIVIDKNNRVIAGNKSLQTFVDGGNQDVIVVETTGEQLVAVKRTDIDLDSKDGREMALADNATGKANLDWDEDVLNEVTEEYEIDADEWGIMSFDDVDVDSFFEEVEATPTKEKDYVISVTIPHEEEDLKSTIVNLLKEALKDYPNISVS